MKKSTKKFLALFSALLLAVSVTAFLPPVDIEAAAAPEVTIIGTIIKTRDYYMVNGPVPVYGFLPSMLTEVTVDGKAVELTECSLGTTASFGTNDLSGYVGVMKAYTGKIYKETGTGPYKYTFALSSVTDIPAGTQIGDLAYMNTYLTSLGYQVESSIEYAPGELAFQANMKDFTVHYYYYMHNNTWGEIDAVIMNPDFSGSDLHYMDNGQAVGGYAKAQKVAKIFAQYANGEITKDAAQKALNSLL